MRNASARPYFPNLDGLRFFAFLFVFISHATLFIWQGPAFLAQGDLGVSFFFVLSGFLITYLLLFEKETSGNAVKLSNFYARRILRIWPVYFITLCVGILVAHFQLMHLPFSTAFKLSAIPWYTGFIANFYLIKYPAVSVLVAVLWSISIEEQFYFVWPLILMTIRKRFIPWFLCTLILIATLFRLFHWQDYNTVAYSTFSAMSDLAIGALSGFLMFYMPALSGKVGRYCTKNKVLLLYGIFIVCLAIKMFSSLLIPHAFYPLYVALMPVVFGLLFVGIIFEQNYSVHSLFKVSRSKASTYLGKISYGLYAYHMIAITVVLYIFSLFRIEPDLAITLISFLTAIGLASLSYKYIEQKVLRLKNKLH